MEDRLIDEPGNTQPQQRTGIHVGVQAGRRDRVCRIEPVTAGPGQQDPVRALLVAGRAFVGLAARSLAAVDDDVTLPQYRALVVLCGHGPRRATDIADELQVNPSTTTRMLDRLARKGLVRHPLDQ